MRPLPNEDNEQFARRITEIAWSNGAFKACEKITEVCGWGCFEEGGGA